MTTFSQFLSFIHADRVLVEATSCVSTLV